MPSSAMPDLQGYWWLDGLDLYLSFGVVLEKGTADFLQLAETKEKIVNNWPDQHGIDVDLSEVFIKENRGTLACRMFCVDENDYFLKRGLLYQQLKKPGLHRLTIKAHGNRNYFVYYESMKDYRQVKNLKGIPDNMICHEFKLTVVEPSPQIISELTGGDGSGTLLPDIFLAVEDGSFLVT